MTAERDALQSLYNVLIARNCTGADWGGQFDALMIALSMASTVLAQEPAPAWQPIETAPKDGARVILSRVDGPVWCDCRWRKMQRVPDRWESFVGPLTWEPTHWMPIPPAPEAK